MKFCYAVAPTVMMMICLTDCNSSTVPRDPNQVASPQHSWVTCEGGDNAIPTFDQNGNITSYSYYQPVLVDDNGNIYHAAGNFSPTQYQCPDTGGSPIWTGSGSSVFKSAPQGVNPNANAQARAAAAPSAAYLPPALLNLPFVAQDPGTPGKVTCNDSQPNVLQVNHDNAAVTRLTSCSFTIVATIPVASNPLQIAITPDGSTALVTSYYNAVNFINLATNQVSSTLSTPGVFPNGVAITPDGLNFYITNFLPTGASILEYNLATQQQIFSMPAATYPQSLFLSPDGSLLFVTFPYANQVWVLDTLTNTVSSTLQISAPRGIAFNSHGTKAYIASTDNPDGATRPGSIQEFDTATFRIDKIYNVGVGPTDVAVLYGDQFVIAVNHEGNSISKIDTFTGAIQTFPTNGRPSGISIVQ